MANIYTSQTPTSPNENQPGGLSIATLWFSAVNGTCTGGRWYFPATLPSGTTVFSLWQYTNESSGTLLAQANFSAPVAGTWNSVTFASPINITAGTLYKVVVTSQDRWVRSLNGFVSSIVNGDLTAPADDAVTPRRQGTFILGNTVQYPTQNFSSSSYFADPTFLAGEQVTPNSITLTMSLGAPSASQTFEVNPDPVELSLELGDPTVTEPSPLGLDLVYPAALALLECLRTNANRLGLDAPQNYCFRIGDEVAHDAGQLVDLCCEGLGYVSLGENYPSAASPPDRDIIRQAESQCPFPAWLVNLRVGIIRCVPVGDGNAGPTCEEWNEAALLNFRDAQVLRIVACCFRDYVRNEPMFLGMSVIIDQQLQSNPSGGCVERWMRVQFQIPNIDCGC